MAASDIWERLDTDAEARLRWLVGFGNLDVASLSEEQRAAVRQEARAFETLQLLDPAIKRQLRGLPAPTDTAPHSLTDAEIWRAQRWLKRGLNLLGRGEKWNYTARVTYELDAPRKLLFTRLKANSRLELFKALAYEAFRDARLKFRLCLDCGRPYVPIRRQAYCSKRCSQAVRTRKWRKAHPEKNRELRRRAYQKAVAARLGLSSAAEVRIAKRRRVK